MPSFRTRVLDALDIEKKTVKLQVNERFPKTHSTDTAAYTDGEHPNDAQTMPDAAFNAENHVNYAVSYRQLTTDIGPSFVTGQPARQTLDVLGFVIGNKPGDGSSGSVTYHNSYPICIDRSVTSDQIQNGTAGEDYFGPQEYRGFHYLNGVYDDHSLELQSIRKSALPLESHDTMTQETGVAEHAHKDWPDNVQDQLHLLNENPWADSLFYHKMRLSFLITGVQLPVANDTASNHRGLVRMLIVKPKMPSVRTRWTGDRNDPVINMAYPPHFDTELFYSGQRTLGGRLDRFVLPHTTSTSGNFAGSHQKSHITPTFGLRHRTEDELEIELDPDSIHYGHLKQTNGKIHACTPFDIMTAPINRKAYTVIQDKTFTLDTQHHGVASQRLENVTIDFGGKIKFPGRKPTVSSGEQTNQLTDTAETGSLTLGSATINEPLNMHSKPIIMFLSMDQKLSAQVTGYTAISET